MEVTYVGYLVKDENKEYKVTHRGDICYNPANLKFGVICVNDFGDAIFSPIYVTFEIQKDVDRDFLSNYLMRWDFIKAVRKYEEGTKNGSKTRGLLKIRNFTTTD